MKFIVLGAAGRMGSLHTKHLRELGHEVMEVDLPGKSAIYAAPDVWPGFQVDGIVIATPAARHAEHINTVLAADHVKHIFVEKPLCLISQLPAMRRMAMDAKQNGVTIHVGYNLRFHPAVQGLRSARLVGAMKPVVHGSLVLRQVPRKLIANFREEWASHEVDLALHLFGNHGIKYVHMEWKPEGPEWRCSIRHAFATSSIYVDGYGPSVRSVTMVDEAGHCFHRDIEADHVRDEHYLEEMRSWIGEIINPGVTTLATAADGIAAINVFNGSSL